MLAHENDDLLESRWSSKLAELNNDPEDFNGGEDADHSENLPCECSVNFSLLREALLHGTVGYGRPEPGASSHVSSSARGSSRHVAASGRIASASRPNGGAAERKVVRSSVRSCVGGGHTGSRAVSGTRFPPVSGTEGAVGSPGGSTPGPLRVESDTHVFPKCKMENVSVNEEVPLLSEWQSPDVYGTAQDPLNVKQETDEVADDQLSICGLQDIEAQTDEVADDLLSIRGLQDIKVEVIDEPLPVSGLSGYIKEDPDLDLAMDTAENWQAVPREHAREATRNSPTTPNSTSPSAFELTDRAAPDSSHSSVDCHTDDTPIPDAKTSPDTSATLTCSSGGTDTYSEETAADVSSEKQRSSAAYTRPPFYYAELIAMAIKHSPERRATLPEICAYIADSFPYYRHSKGWQRSLSDQLSRKKWFVKLPQEGSREKLSCWTLDQQYEDTIQNGIYRQEKRRKTSFSRGRVGAETYPTQCPASTSPSVSKVGCADSVACDSGVNHCTDDAPVSETETSTDVSATLTSTSGGETTAAGGTEGSSEERCSSAAYTRPPFSYAQLIAMAIKNSPQRRATQLEIRTYIAESFPYYRHIKGWQKQFNDILSCKKWFVKLPQEGSVKKGSYWTLDRRYEDMYEIGICRQEKCRKTSFSRGRVGAETYPTQCPTSTSPSVSKVGCADLVACDSGVNHCTDDAPVSETETSTDVSATLTSASSGETTAAGGTEGSSEERCSSAAYTRPPFCYAELIAMAIKNSPQRRATLPEICAYVADRFPYYRHSEGWQKSLGDRLSRKKWFVKLPQEGCKEKYSYWTLDPQYEDSFENCTCRQGQRRKLLLCRSRVGAETYPTHHHSESSPAEGSCSSVSISDAPTRDGPEVQTDNSVQYTAKLEASRENGGGTIRPAVGHEEASVRLQDAGEHADCGRPTFSCSVCHRVFAVQYKLNVHFRMHTGERPYVCNICGKAFRVCSKMKRHWHLHSGERPYSCDVCGRKFKRRDHLNRHMSVKRRKELTAALSTKRHLGTLSV